MLMRYLMYLNQFLHSARISTIPKPKILRKLRLSVHITAKDKWLKYSKSRWYVWQVSTKLYDQDSQ